MSTVIVDLGLFFFVLPALVWIGISIARIADAIEKRNPPEKKP